MMVLVDMVYTPSNTLYKKRRDRLTLISSLCIFLSQRLSVLSAVVQLFLRSKEVPSKLTQVVPFQRIFFFRLVS